MIDYVQYPASMIEPGDLPRGSVQQNPNGNYNVYDNDGHRRGTIEEDPTGRLIYRDFQTGRRRTR